MITDIPCRGNTVSTGITHEADSETKPIFMKGLFMRKSKKSANAHAVTSNTKSVNATPKVARLFTKDGKIMHFDLGLAKDIIADFVKQCMLSPGCLTQAMMALSNDYASRCYMIENQKKMSPEEIIEDAEVIYATMEKLSQDFAKEHEHANAVCEEILGHYVPGLPKALRQVQEIHTVKSDVASVRNQEQELEKAKKVIANFVKTCSHNPDSKKNALISLTNEYFGQRLYRSKRKAMSPDTIIADAAKITATMEKLMSDYSEQQEEQAYEVMDDILSRYVPDLKLVMDNNMKKKGK